MRDWDWIDWLMASFVALVVGLLAVMIISLVMNAKADEKFRASGPGKTYQTLVMELGTPTDRETFPDGTEVICWKKHHEATTTMVISGKVIMPIYHPAHTTGWKAIMRGGRCLRIDEL